MSQWVSVGERMPKQKSANVVYDSKPYIVSDDFNVGVCDFCRGNGSGHPWAEWSTYGDIKPHKIVFWMPMPEPPQ